MNTKSQRLESPIHNVPRVQGGKTDLFVVVHFFLLCTWKKDKIKFTLHLICSFSLEWVLWLSYAYTHNVCRSFALSFSESFSSSLSSSSDTYELMLCNANLEHCSARKSCLKFDMYMHFHVCRYSIAKMYPICAQVHNAHAFISPFTTPSLSRDTLFSALIQPSNRSVK